MSLAITQEIYRAIVIGKLTYASRVWWADDRQGNALTVLCDVAFDKDIVL